MKPSYLNRLFAFVLSISCFTFSSAQTVYVDASATGSNNGTSWKNAYKSLAVGLDDAWQDPTVDSIVIAKGTYVPDSLPYNMQASKKGVQITSSVNRDKTFHLRTGLEVYGGYPSGGGARHIANNETILSGKFGSGTNDHSFHVVLMDASSNWVASNDTTKLDGLTVQEGKATGNGSLTVNGKVLINYYGGGVIVNGGTSIISHSTINGNEATTFGGGMYVSSSNNTVNNSTISGNAGGGGIFMHFSSSFISNSTISGNTSSIYGGGIYVHSSTSFIINSTINGNKANIFGGGMFVYSSNNTVSNSTISGNTASYYGGGIHGESSTNTVINSTISRNTADLYNGGGIYATSCTLTVYNSILWSNKAGVSSTVIGSDFNCVSGIATFRNNILQLTSTSYSSSTNNDLGTKANNIYAKDPLFENASDLDGVDNIHRTADDGLRLKSSSPALDKGNNSFIASGITTDIMDLARIQNSIVDIGAYEGYFCPSTFATINPDVCDSYTSPSGKTWTTSGTRLDTIQNAANCDSIITVNLTIRNKSFATISPDVCDSYSSPSGKTWTTSNTYLDTIPNAANCDSIITVNLTIRNKSFKTIAPDVCNSFKSPSGKTWTTSNTYLDTIPNTANCDSIITVNLTILNKSFKTIAPDVCNSFKSPSGKTWTTSNTYLDTIPNAANCDSIITVNLTIRNKTFAAISPDVCDSYTSPSGKTWTTSNTYLDTIPNAANCDSIITVNLTIRNKSFKTIAPDVCNSFKSPSGKTWTTSNTYLDTIPNAANCDSIITVNLTIRNKTVATINPDVCNSYTSPSGKPWTTSNTYLDTIPNAANCDSIITVKLTIRNKTFATINPNVCDSYTSPSGKTWTTSNTYLDTISNAATCDSIITVNLTIRNKTFATINPDVCDSYTSPSGKTWTTSNTYLDTISNAATCDSIITVNLTIRNKTFATINPDVCDGYISPSGKTWTTSGTRKDTILNAANCDSIITVNLTIRNKTFATINPDVCDSYESPSGKTWTTSGTRKDTILNAANCDSIITVNLTIRNKSFATINPDVCDSYTSPSGKTLFISGTHKDTINNSAGCDSIITINLVVKAVPIATVSTIAGNGIPGLKDSNSISAQFNQPIGIAIDVTGNIYVADRLNHRIRKITPSGMVTTLAGSSPGYRDDTGTAAQLNNPSGVVVDDSGNVYVADYYNRRIRKITAGGVVSTFAGSGNMGSNDGTGTVAEFNNPQALAFDNSGNLYVADPNDHRIRKISPLGVVSTFAGNGNAGFKNGIGSSAQFNHPRGVVVDDSGNVFVADQNSHRIRKISPTGIVTTFAGNGTVGFKDGNDTSAQFNYPTGITIDGFGNVIVADTENHSIRKITPSGVVSTIVGNESAGFKDTTGCLAQFDSPLGVVVNRMGDLFVADLYNHRIRKIVLSIGTAATTSTTSPNVCDSYTSPSGKTWTTSGTRNDTIPNAANCDSIITVNLTIRNKSFKTETITAYESYTSPSGKTWTTSRSESDTIDNDAGCDSIITVNLTIINKLFVDVASSGTGGSWGSPLATLDAALRAANATSNDVEIWIKEGTYYPSASGGSPRDSSFLITNTRVRLLGGFAGTETNADQRNTSANPTTLCADIGKKGDSSDNAYHVLVIAPPSGDIGPDFVLDGLIIRDGNADGGAKKTYNGVDVYQNEGGGLSIKTSGAGQVISPTITNCQFDNNYGDYGGSVYIKAENGKSFATFSSCTFKDGASIYGAMYNDGQSGEVSPNIINCVFDNNTSETSGAAIYNYGYGGKASPIITSCVFNDNRAATHGGAVYNNGYAGTSSPVIMNSTFHKNEAGSSGGAMYSFGNSGTCRPKVTNSILYKNMKAGDDDHKFSEFYNYVAYPFVSYSSLQRASGTYSTATANSLNFGSNNKFEVNPSFMAMSNTKGTDGVWRTGDDGLRLSGSSSLMNVGTSTGAPTTDILGNQRNGSTDMGAYEYVSCGLNVKLATATKTHTATQTVTDNGFTCYCNSDNELLLALDTNGTGAVITPSQVKLYIGNPTTLSYNSAGGMITNTAGGVILERRWDVDPTTQPTSPVKVRYFYTKDNYDDIVTAMAGLTSPTTISSPSQLQFYKVTGGSTATFPNPHDAGVTGIVLTNGTTPGTTTWVNGTHGVQDHSAEYLVSSFSGGGGGGGGGSAPLPVELIEFTAQKAPNHSAELTWKTASELNNSHFVIERSNNGNDFQEVAVVAGNGTTQSIITYTHTDQTIAPTQNTVYYRLRQVDFDGTEALSPVRLVKFEAQEVIAITKVYPNPTKGNVTIAFPEDDEVESHQIIVLDGVGRTVQQTTTDQRETTVDLSNQPSGLYFIKLDTGETIKIVKE